MKKIILLALVLMASIANAKMGSEGVGGGAGVKKNGVYKTFYSAGLYVEPKYIDTEEIPGLNETVEVISGMNFLSIDVKTSLINALLPSNERQYFIAKPEGLTLEIQNKLLEAFSKATGQNPEQINLFGLTDKVQRTTYLLPSYFELETLQERQAALLHEALWIAFPRFTYENIIQAEMAFQAILDNPNNFAAITDFLTRVGGKQIDIVRGALYQDSKINALKGLLDVNGKISFNVLFGEEYFNCIEAEKIDLSNIGFYVFAKDYQAKRYGDNFNLAKCSSLAKLNILRLSNVYKKSLVLKLLLKSFERTAYNNFLIVRTATYDFGEFTYSYSGEKWKKFGVVDSLVSEYLSEKLSVSGTFLQKCSVDFSLANADKNNITCPNLGNIKNISGRFGFGATLDGY